jgi:WD40 repeat protein
VKKWSLRNGRHVLSFTGLFEIHSILLLGNRGFIRPVFVTENFLFTGGQFSDVKQWNKETAELIRLFSGLSPDMEISALKISEDYLFVGSRDPAYFLIQWRVSDGSIVRGYPRTVSIV